MGSEDMLQAAESRNEVVMIDCSRVLKRCAVDQQRGVSLVELMIAMALGLLVLAAVVQLFIGSRQTYSATEGVARMQETGRFALEFIKPNLRQANNLGFCGAAQINDVTNHLDIPDSAADDLLNIRWVVTGWEYEGTGYRENGVTIDDLTPPNNLNDWNGPLDLPSALAGRVVPFSDILMIRHLDKVPELTATNNNQQTSSTINTNAPSSGTGIDECTVLFITNCTWSDLFQKGNNATANSLTKTGGNCSPGNRTGNNAPDWSTEWGDDMQAYVPRQSFFYIGFNENRGEPGLYRMEMARGSANVVIEELVEGVETMQILYGISYPDDWTPPGDGQSINEWRMADEINNWDLVIAVSVALLVRSPDGVGTRRIQRTFDVNGTEVTSPRDSRLREVFRTSVSLRNRLIVDN